MLPELIYREERAEDYPLLALLGALSAFAGFGAASYLFPTQVDVLAVVFASIPLVYPLTRFFLEDEEDGAPHIPEIQVYGSIFFGEVVGFLLLGMFFPDSFSLQSSIVGASGFAVFGDTFLGILSNNLAVFGSIFALSAFIGSAGAFVLTWNASVLGVFFARLLESVETSTGFFTCSPVPSPICYAPHTFFEMTGFIIAGVSGSLISAAVYREHFDREAWIDYAKLLLIGASMILIGALLESV